MVKKNILKTTKVALLLILCSIFGCNSDADYKITISNISDATIEEAHVVYGSFKSAGGVIPSGDYATHLFPDVPIPETAIVQWRTQDGVMHKKSMGLKTVLPKKFSGELKFEIDNENNVTLQIE